MNAINFKVYPSDKAQLKAVKSVFKAFKIRFEIEEDKPYDTKFVNRVLEAKDEIKQGKGVNISTADLWK